MKRSSLMAEKINKTILVTIIAAVFLFSSQLASGQKIVTEKPPLRERIFFGGNMALQLGTLTDIELLPVAGIWLLPRIAVAAGPGFRYYSFNGTHTNVFSGRAYLQLVPIRDIDRLIPVGVHTSIILQLEDEVMSLDSKYWHNVDLSPKRFTVNTVLAGPGISQQLGKKSSMNIVVLWGLAPTDYELYSNPVIRIGIVF
jgi:hypothetical protein